jgi:3D (Asp-Asp-Asp) domain-containing protein
MLSILLTALLFHTQPVHYVAQETPEPTVIEAKVTAYSEYDSCHYKNCAMATTNRAYKGAIACPREYELYTKVRIEGKVYTCEDRTNKDLNGRWDIFMGYGQESYDRALTFGIKTLTVEIYEI